jgi:eukaryotic-like serine/threonine-protein kinase
MGTLGGATAGATARARDAVRRGQRLPRLVRQAIALVLGILAGVLLFDRLLMPVLVRHGDEVRVPSVGGVELAQAEKSLRVAGLRPLVMTGRHHAVVPRGDVLEVSPPSGLSVKRGRQVILTPSLGAFHLTVPNLVGQTMRLARIQLGDAGLAVGEVMYAANDLVEGDVVMAMEPEGGAPAPENSTVSLLVSRPRPSTGYWLPDLRGLPGTASEILLEQGGFSVTVQTEAGGEPGTVVRQDPPPGVPLWPGTHVVLSVAPGWGRGSGRG